ncbi:AEC family transporter [Pelagibius sp.]|uniref:AEC family transporter n=1 Tax=Pelagibius sp. TaxID=1931238 RepID=UPI00260CBB7A|nr:AEC family transporter [Pelagibius sp.]
MASPGRSGKVRAMGPILNVVFPVFGIMLAGYLAGRFRILGNESSEALNRFVYFIALPALFFISMARVSLDQVFNLPFLAAYGGGVAFTFVLAFVVARFAFPNRLGALGLGGLSAIFSNTGYMGIPLLMLAFGEAGMLPAIITTILNGAVIMALGIALLELDVHQGKGAVTVLRGVLGGILRSPLVISAALGLGVSALGLPIPQALATFCDILGAAAGPCALFAIGLFMVGKSFTAGMTEVGWLVLLKLAVQPLVTWWLAFQVFTMDPIWAAGALIQSALPTGALVFVLAQQYGIYIQRSTAVIMISTVVSLATLSALFVYLGIG